MKPRKVPLRLCVGCQQMKPKKELLRIVRTPEGAVVIDPTGKKAGRGAYLCPQVECLERAVQGRRLDKALATSIGPEVEASLREQLRRQE